MKNSFSINIIFLLLTLVGILLIPRLPVQLFPQAQGESLRVTFQWRGMSSQTIEQEATSPMEGALSAMRGVQNIRSQSYKDWAEITLEFKKGTDMDAARFEAASILRSLHGKLPQGVVLPVVNLGWGGSGNDTRLLVYTINGNGSAYDLQQHANRHLVSQITHLPGISSVNVWGAMPLQWQIIWHKNQLNDAGLTINDLRSAISNHLTRQELGSAVVSHHNQSMLVNLAYSGHPSDTLNWNNVVVANKNGRIVRLTDVATPRLIEAEPISYFRVNGLSTLYLVVNAEKGANQLTLATEVKAIIDELRSGLPPGFSLMVNYDASKEISHEMTKTTSRALSALVILLLFVLLISRNWRYLLVISLSLMANLTIAVIFYYALGIEIQLYSLAGITVSLGMVIDNTIVMADHLRHKGDRKVFMALLAATLTTMGAMVVIFFLKQEQRMNLVDFALVMLVNLGVSLAVSLWFVPALMHQLPIKAATGARQFKRKRRVYRWSQRNVRFLQFAFRWRWAFVVAMVWGFGIPVFLLPDKIEPPKEGDMSKAAEWYNKTLGNQTFVSDVKPWMNRILGGSWYLFSSYFGQSDFNNDPSRTVLYARAQMPEGSTLEQMDLVIRKMEQYIAQFNEVELFSSNVNSGTNASIEITFKKEFENGAFPFELKNRLIDKANETGSADFSIYGVGQGFSNAYHEGMQNNKIILRGYNYDRLMSIAETFKDSLLRNPRIKEVLILSESSWMQKPRYEYVLAVDGQRLAESGSSPYNLHANLMWQSPSEAYSGYANDQQAAVYLREAQTGNTSVWELNNHLLLSNRSAFRLAQVGSLKKQRAGLSIKKENQEYILTVAYDFIGPYELNRRVRERDLKTLNDNLSLGFSARDGSNFWGWNQKEESQYWLLLIVLGVVYFICAILLNSLIKPLAVIAAIPLSFIGIFLSFSLLKIQFDQGGYAAMVLLCGLTVNSALYIVNHYNIILDKGRIQLPLRAFVKAYNHKIVPILLTITSTILGMLPFIYDGTSAGIWYTLAIGAGGGLLFSIPAVALWMPLIMIGRGKVPECQRKKVPKQESNKVPE
ncbi:multidrug efflux pump subunit AcrB [Breznakibacter xylanolyticus]|uniref:Multidrug efflux pump subunit AcrB n=1 Tax=Breznakibacter xylanolyticus TaxID=990 RepID=A0A2W7NJS2_9BACT|nr:efflux RND transporter permease subunit [Breznakibacter xylanolyticus]PZX13426.1 multidrug efflux pump subunit AcrB [Breznakibacter xylanolyticus]